jgi:GMP synthase-like glutamine amidotransferase
MRIAILETGRPPGDLAEQFCDYPAMFRDLLAGPDHSFTTYDVAQGQYPAQDAFDALVVTGSPAGAYDPLPWIEPLKAFLKASKGKPMVGVCFGHQIMAEAFGGRVEKSSKGFAIGLHRYCLDHREPWMADGTDETSDFALPASHQDQVVQAPPHAHVVASSGFTPFAALAYDDQPAISFQGHPEFDPAFAAALIEHRRDRLGAAKADAGVASLSQPNDRLQVGRWIVQFLQRNAPPV